MIDDNVALLAVQIIAGIVTIFGVWYANQAQDKRDDKKRAAEKAAAEAKEATAKKEAAAKEAIELAKLKKELETELWLRLQEDYEDERTKRKALDATVKEQGAIIMQLRDHSKKQDDRIATLEADRDNWMERALKAENGKAGKMGL